MATDKLEKETLQFRSEIQLLSEQLELVLRLNSSDFTLQPNCRTWLFFWNLIAGAEEKLRLVVSERAAASAAASSLESLCRQLEQQVDLFKLLKSFELGLWFP